MRSCERLDPWVSKFHPLQKGKRRRNSVTRSRIPLLSSERGKGKEGGKGEEITHKEKEGEHKGFATPAAIFIKFSFQKGGKCVTDLFVINFSLEILKLVRSLTRQFFSLSLFPPFSGEREETPDPSFLKLLF